MTSPKKTLQKIKNIQGDVLWKGKAADIKEALEIASAQKIDLPGAYLEGATLIEADLREADLEGAYLRGAYLEGANLEGANLREGYLRETNLRGANLEGANLKGAYLEGADLEGANLRGADLEGANLKEANLRGADLRETNLRGADLEGANLGSDLICLSDLSDAVDLAPMIFEEWETKGLDKARDRFGLYCVGHKSRALISMAPDLSGGFCYILSRREIWWWQWKCPDPMTVPVLARL